MRGNDVHAGASLDPRRRCAGAPYRRQPRAEVGQGLHRHAADLVLAAVHLAQVEVLHRVVGLGEREHAARAVDLGGFHGLDDVRLARHIALHGIGAGGQQLRGVVALHRVHVRLELVGLGVVGAEGLVAGVGQAIGIVQRGFQPLRRRALGLQRAIGQEAGAVQRNLVLEPGRLPVLDELDRAAAGEEHEHGVRLERGHLGDQRLELHVRERQAQLLHDLAAPWPRRLP